MKANFELLKADIQDELNKLARLNSEFNLIADVVDKSVAEISFYDQAAISYYLHSFYNGCENIFKSIARFFENDLQAQTWHYDLLKRMKLIIPGYRTAVIDEQLFVLLDEFRRFRHIVRHSYTFELNWERESFVAKKLIPTYQLFYEQLQLFLQQLEQIMINDD